MKLFKNVRLLKKGNEYEIKDVLFSTIIEKIEDWIDEKEADEVIEQHGKVLLPGLIDVHVHLREPGFLEKETIATGTLAAAKGGYTSIFAMPNVQPYPDRKEVMMPYLKKIQEEAHVNVYPYACITMSEEGSSIVDMEEIASFGLWLFSDDGVGVQSAEKMLQAMQKAKRVDGMIVAHAEDMAFRTKKACMHEGVQNYRIGYEGIPSCCEYLQIARDIELVRQTGVSYHICHMSTKESVDLLRKAKQEGLPVSGEVTTHHLLLNEDDVHSTNEKMNPPLRSEEDRLALLEGLKDGTIDCIANDHAPHTEEDKAKSMEDAPFGVVGLETAFPLLYTYFVKTGRFTMEELVEKMSVNPAKRFRLERQGEIKVGKESNMVLIDLEKSYVIKKENLISKGKNTPFEGWKCETSIMETYVRGTCVYRKK